MPRPGPRTDGKPTTYECRLLAVEIANSKSRAGRAAVDELFEKEGLKHYQIFRTLRLAARAALDEKPTRLTTELRARLEALLKQWPLLGDTPTRKAVSIKFPPDLLEQIDKHVADIGSNRHAWMIDTLTAALPSKGAQHG